MSKRAEQKRQAKRSRDSTQGARGDSACGACDPPPMLIRVTRGVGWVMAKYFQNEKPK